MDAAVTGTPARRNGLPVVSLSGAAQPQDLETKTGKRNLQLPCSRRRRRDGHGSAHHGPSRADDPAERRTIYTGEGWKRFYPAAAPYTPSQAEIDRLRRPMFPEGVPRRQTYDLA